MNIELGQLGEEELEHLATSIEDDPDNVACLLFPDCPDGNKTVVQQIGQWAVNRKLVLENTANGNTHIASVFEKVCYRFWQRLPSYAKRAKVPDFLEK